MGTRLAYTCRCGYTGGGSLGGGKLDFESFCGAPAICRTCAVVKTVNALAPLSCPTCRGAVELLADERGEEGASMAMSWRLRDSILVIRPGPHVCPKCQRAALSISHAGHFD
jgi:hypothetical protein